MIPLKEDDLYKWNRWVCDYKIASTIGIMLVWFMKNILSKNKVLKAVIKTKIKIKGWYNVK